MIVVMVLGVIGVIGVAAMIAPVIGHRVSDCCAADAAHDRADRTANNGPSDSAADRSVTAPLSSANAICDEAQINTAAERTINILDIEAS